MEVDKNYCMSSFLMFRKIVDSNKCFKMGLKPNLFNLNFERVPIIDSNELENALRKQVKDATKDGKAALALSGGIDSAILAKFMPRGSTVYTFKCIVPGVEVTDETVIAAKYAKECGLKHKVIEIYWEDFERYASKLMIHKGAPIHSIEVQIYKGALQAKNDGFSKLIFGESADSNYGGLSGLLSRDWNIGEFVDRYSYVLPYKTLKEPQLILEPYIKHNYDGLIDVHEFCTTDFLNEALGSYTNACETAGIELIVPYAKTFLNKPLDYERVRNGENKYLIREVFSRLYNEWNIPLKTPMPRPMTEWLRDWEGPVRPEFWEHCTDNMTGDQKWLVYALEKFLNITDEKYGE